MANRPAHRSFRAPQIIRGLFAGHPVEIAEDDRLTEPIGEPLDLLVQECGRVVGDPCLGGPQGAGGLLDVKAAGGGGPSPDRGPVGDPVQPGPQGVPAADRPRLAEQQHEGGLEGVVGRVRVLQDRLARVQYQSPITCHQRGERRLVPVSDEPLQQASVG